MNESDLQTRPNIIRYKARGTGTKNLPSDQYARLLISVGQPYHEGPKLAAALKWADDNFDRKVIFLADTLQRYNMMMNGMLPDEAWDKSRHEGDLWLKRHASLIGNTTVFRWEQATTHENYVSERWKIGRLYNNNKLVKSELDKAIKDVAIRRSITPENMDHFENLSIQYLLEEAAGRAVENEIYPGVSAYPNVIPEFWSIFGSLPDLLVPKGLVNDQLITLELKKAS